MSLAYYFRGKGIDVSGFSSRREIKDSGIRQLCREDLIKSSGIIFITVTDSAIEAVWNEIKEYDLTDKIICHCSGSLSSDIFFGANRESVCSVHPMLAFDSGHTSSENISRAFFTLEGGGYAVRTISELLNFTGNRFKTINKRDKAKYHAAACFASNFVVAVCDKAEELLSECGFDRHSAHEALVPLMRGNMENIISHGTAAALTGPAARGDMITIEKHMEALGKDRELYRALTSVIFAMGGSKDENDNSRI